MRPRSDVRSPYPMPSLFAGTAVLVLATACGPVARTHVPIVEAPVDDDTFEEVRRQYLSLAPDDPRRDEVRSRLVEHLAARTDARLAQDDYDAVVRHLASMTELLSPVDFVEGGTIPEQIAPIARYVAERGARRGDEARVLAALLLLSYIEPDGRARREEYERVAAWGREARWGREPRMGPDFFDLAPRLVQVWEEHARLSPAPEVLASVANLYVQLRDLVLGASVEQGFAPPSRGTLTELRMAHLFAERIPLDVAAVYLRVGDLRRAAERLAQLGDRGGLEWRLRRLIERADGEGEESAQALLELSGGFERTRPEVAVALCRLGHGRHRSDVRFALCLARLSSDLDRPAEATAWYAEAVQRAPEERQVYDEALGRLARLIEQGLFTAESDIARVRVIGRHAALILEERARRWPAEPAPISAAELELQLGRAEMHAGNVAEAERHLRASLAARRSREALAALALLEARTGDAPQAVALFREALERLSQQGPEAAAERADLLERLGDALRAAGRDDEARRAYAQALDLLTPLADAGDEARRALTRVRLGVLRRRLGRAQAADEAFRAAIDVAPSWREPYAEILAHLVVSEPDPRLAAEVFHRATTGLALEQPWRVYFALWAQAIAERASEPPSEEVRRTLADQAREPGWHGRLAAFGAGSLGYEQLLAAAQNPGQRCEAHFYAGARKLAQGDRDGARTAFFAAIETGMVGYFEYAMAQELLATLR